MIILPFLALPPGLGGAMALTARGRGGRRREWFLRAEGVRIERGGRREEERLAFLVGWER